MTILLLTFLSFLLLNTPAVAFNEAHLKKLQAFGDCEQCDLSGATLTEATLPEARLNRAKLCKTQMPWGEDNSGC